MNTLTIEKNKNLKEFNTFGFDVMATYFTAIHSIEQIHELINTLLFKSNKHLIIGGGSNILLRGNFDGLVIKVGIKGIEAVNQTDTTVTLKIGAGEEWHKIVMYCVTHNWGGIENLSLIPGSVGAAPIQNIGAYGVEIKDVIQKVEGVDLQSGDLVSFTNHQCLFGYRESIFKHEWKGKIFITHVTITLTTKKHRLNTQYGAILHTLNEMNIQTPCIETISNAIIQIRKSKLPNPVMIGNAGSFFKNPIITSQQLNLLKEKYPTIPYFTSVNQEVKIPAGWLIEQCEWKGKTINHVGVHVEQALVLVNYGKGTGEAIYDLAMKIIARVKEKFNITLTLEVNVVN